MKPTKSHFKTVTLGILIAGLFYFAGIGTVAASYYSWFIENTYFHIQTHILDALQHLTRISFGIGAGFLIAIIGLFCIDLFSKKKEKGKKKGKKK